MIGMHTKIRIAIADDHALFRQGLRPLLELREEIAVVDETDRADDVLPMLERSPCDVLPLDLQMDRNLLADIGALAQRSKVVVVTATERPEDALAAIRAGAHAVVFKRYAVETLMQAIEAAARGEIYMPPNLQNLLATSLREGPHIDLTVREREIVRFVALGLHNAEVARRLSISEQTVKTHLNNIFHKLRVRDRVELTRYAIRTGIVGSHEPPP
jgi:two-component system NarL family response regulator